MAGGFPISGVVGRADVMDAPGPGGLGGTYAGSPIGCAAALAVLKVFEDENLLQRSRAIGERLIAGLRRIARRHAGDRRRARPGRDGGDRAVRGRRPARARRRR